MKILFVHQNFPAQFGRLAEHLAADPANTVVGLGQRQRPAPPGVRHLLHRPHRAPAAGTHPYARPFEQAVLNGQSVARKLLTLREQGFVPDVVYAHPGWGEALYVKEVVPEAALILFCEFFYHSEGADVGFDPEFPSTLDGRLRARSKNATQLMTLDLADAGVAPTAWQRSLYPAEFRDKIHVIHDGIDTERMRPGPHAALTLPDGRVLTARDPVITYVARNLEPYRGFHVFMRAAERIQQAHPTCHLVVVGGDDVSYGRPPADGGTWRAHYTAACDLDPDRIHFLGRVPYETYRAVLQISSAHIYLTYPFVLSWSVLEAMAAECLVIGSRTAPVTEVIADGQNGLLADFFAPDEIAARALDALDRPQAMQPLRRAARETVVAHYDFERRTKPALDALIRGWAAGAPSRTGC